MSKGVAWITGASSGIGRAIAVELAAAGWRVGVGARRENALDGLGEAAAGLDVCDRDSVARWAIALRGRIGDPDLVVNAAGWGIFETVQSTSDGDWDRTIATNLTGSLLCDARNSSLDAGARLGAFREHPLGWSARRVSEERRL